MAGASVTPVPPPEIPDQFSFYRPTPSFYSVLPEDVVSIIQNELLFLLVSH
jgi:hypothetical protein